MLSTEPEMFYTAQHIFKVAQICTDEAVISFGSGNAFTLAVVQIISLQMSAKVWPHQLSRIPISSSWSRPSGSRRHCILCDMFSIMLLTAKNSLYSYLLSRSMLCTIYAFTLPLQRRCNSWFFFGTYVALKFQHICSMLEFLVSFFCQCSDQ